MLIHADQYPDPDPQHCWWHCIGCCYKAAIDCGGVASGHGDNSSDCGDNWQRGGCDEENTEGNESAVVCNCYVASSLWLHMFLLWYYFTYRYLFDDNLLLLLRIRIRKSEVRIQILTSTIIYQRFKEILEKSSIFSRPHMFLLWYYFKYRYLFDDNLLFLLRIRIRKSEVRIQILTSTIIYQRFKEIL